jgi:hypothetical protein
MKWLFWFLAGALAVPLAHHPVMAAFYAAGIAPYRPYSFQPTQPLGVPQVISLSFWGGVWGLVLGLVLSQIQTPSLWWIAALVFGALAPTIVAGIILRIKGSPIKPTPALVICGFVVNAAWGIGAAVIYKLLNAWRAT